ncbi:MAG: ABC transporter substrate-binding protein [Caldilineae bacterium]|nr:MAG: ABC transporter substrate-binding protein [Caldilineae bacterium]
MKRSWLPQRWYVFLAVGLLLVLASACAPPPAAPAAPAQPEAPAATEAPAQPAAPKAPIKIGCSLPQTGPFAETAAWIQRGYEQWAEEINASGGLLGRPVELIIYDDESSAENAVSLLNRVITADKVDLLCGGYPGTAAAAQMAVAEKHQMVYVSMGGHMASFEQGYTYSFGAPPLMGQWWYDGLFRWLETVPPEERPTKAAVFTMNNPIGASVVDLIPTELENLGIELVVNELYDLPLADAAPLVSKAKAAEADMFFSNGFFADGVQTVQAMKALDYNPKLFAQAVGSIIPAWVEELGPDGDYVFSGTAIHFKLPYEGIDHLNQVAQEKYDSPVAPTYFLFGYAWMQALQRGVEGAGTLDQTAIRDWLKSHEITTVAGTFTFDERGLPPPYNFLTQVIDGQVELIWPPEVRTHEPVYPKPPWGQ